jgi:hypothetical protein
MIGFLLENDLDIGSSTDLMNLRDHGRLVSVDPWCRWGTVAKYHAPQSCEGIEGRQIMNYIIHMHMKPPEVHLNVGYGLRICTADEEFGKDSEGRDAAQVEDAQLERQDMSLCVHFATGKHDTALLRDMAELEL